MIIDTFLYNDLRYNINLGKKPLLIGNTKLDNFNSVPYVEWMIDFGLMDEEFKNYIEKVLIEEDEIFLKTKIHPYIELIYSEENSILSYIYPNEKKFYGQDKLDISRTLEYSLSGSNILYDGKSYDKGATVGLSKGTTIAHKVFFLGEALTIVHKVNGLFQVSAKFKEFFSPINGTYNSIGVTNVNNPGAI